MRAQAGARVTPGLTLMWFGLNFSPRVMTAHRDAGVLVGQGHDGRLPARTLLERQGPSGDGVAARMGGVDHRFGALDQQGAQVGVAAFGDRAQATLAAAGVLFGREAEPGAELGAALELLEVAPRWLLPPRRRWGRCPSTARRGAPARCPARARPGARRTRPGVHRVRATALARGRSSGGPGRSSHWHRPRGSRPEWHAGRARPWARQRRTPAASRGCG